MTTAAETLAPHVAAIARQLGRIADALEPHDASGKRPVSRCEATSPQGDYGPVPESKAVRSPHRAAEGHLTVGQLSAEHIGKRVSIDGGMPALIIRVQHVAKDWTWIDHDDGNRTSGHPDTPCTVIDDEARR